MTQQPLSREWRIVSSTSRFFPVQSQVCLTPQTGSTHCELAVNWEDQEILPMFKAEVPNGPPGAFRGPYDHRPKNKPNEPPEKFEIVVTVCPELKPGSPRFLCGQVYPLTSQDEPGPVGVWVAEEDRPKGSPES